jgi:hypothetical protein
MQSDKNCIYGIVLYGIKTEHVIWCGYVQRMADGTWPKEVLE